MSGLFYILAALSGILVKGVDQLEDKYKDGSALKYAAAIMYGILIGYTISFASFSTLWLAALFAQLIAGKINRYSHMLGFSIALLVASVFQVHEFSMVDFALLFLLAFMDEENPFEWPSYWRPALKIGAAVYALLGRVDYFIAIIAFDALYLITDFFLRRTKASSSV